MLKYDDLTSANILLDIAEERIKRSNNSLMLVVSGKTGSGKSFCSLKIADFISKKLGTPFSIEKNVHFGLYGFMKSIVEDDLKRGTVLVFEEAGVDLTSRRSMSTSNVNFGKVLQTIRHRGLVFIFNLPRLGFLDKSARELIHYNIETMNKIDDRRGLCFCRVKELHPHSWKDAIYKLNLQVFYNGCITTISKYAFGKPPHEYIEPYEKKKRAFTNALNKLVFDQLAQQPENIEIVEAEKKEKQKAYDKKMNDAFKRFGIEIE